MLVLSAVAATGCAQSTPGKEFFMIEAVRPSGVVQTPSDATLEVYLLNVDTAFASKNLVYRLGEFQYETDYYRQFLVTPGQMITERTRRLLADSGLFKQILPPSSQITPTYSLQGIVTSLYGDFTNKAAPAAVMEIRVFLLANAAGRETVVFAETYRAATAVPARTADALVAAFNQSLIEILTHLETDLQKPFPAQTDTPGAARNL